MSTITPSKETNEEALTRKPQHERPASELLGTNITIGGNTPMPRQALAALFRVACKRAGHTSGYQIAKATGLSQSTVHAILHGESSPTVETLERAMGAIDWELLLEFRPRHKACKSCHGTGKKRT